MKSAGGRTRIGLPLLAGKAVGAKLASRGIFTDHLEEIVMQAHHPTLVRIGRQDAHLLYGRHRGGRYLLVVLFESRDLPGLFVVATARDMDLAERRLYQRFARGAR